MRGPQVLGSMLLWGLPGFRAGFGFRPSHTALVQSQSRWRAPNMPEALCSNYPNETKRGIPVPLFLASEPIIKWKFNSDIPRANQLPLTDVQRGEPTKYPPRHPIPLSLKHAMTQIKRLEGGCSFCWPILCLDSQQAQKHLFHKSLLDARLQWIAQVLQTATISSTDSSLQVLQLAPKCSQRGVLNWHIAAPTAPETGPPLEQIVSTSKD